MIEELFSNNVHFQNLTYSVSIGNTQKEILKNISGTFHCGQITALMGPSGAGKSTLLNILSGFVKHNVQGFVSTHTNKTKTNHHQLKMSYILQDDNLYSNFTVQETMLLAANLKISNISMDKKLAMINSILDDLHLTQTKTTYCGSLSGGQRKRLSIALELLDNPPIMFLDEPTSGLDITSATHCIELLRKLAHGGRTIVCTIHQPSASIFEMFDHVYVLAEGNCVYQGTANNTVMYLSSVGLDCPHYHNSADYLIEVVSGEYGNFITRLTTAAEDIRWRHNKTNQITLVTDVAAEKNNNDNNNSFDFGEKKKLIFTKTTTCTTNNYNQTIKRPSEWFQFWVLVGRCCSHYHRDYTVTYLKLALHIMVAVLIGLLFGNSGTNAAKSLSNVSYLLATCIYLWYTAVMPSTLKFPSELPIIKKETFNNWYRLRTYYLAHTLVSTPINTVFAVTYCGISYVMTDQPMEFNRFFKFTITLVVMNILADAIGLSIGAVLNPINGTFWGAILSAVNIALSGYMAIISHVSRTMQLAMSFVSMSYSLEAIILSIYDHNKKSLICPETEIYCHYRSPNKILDEIAMKPNNFNFDFGMLILQLIFVKFFGYFLLRRCVKFFH